MPTRAAAIADSLTSANPSADYRRLLENERRDLVATLQGAAGGKLDQAAIDKTRQGPPLADPAWLNASRYDFAMPANQQADIQLLAGFPTVPRWVLLRNDEAVEDINHGAIPEQQQHALLDAEHLTYIYYVAEALGPRLGDAFLRAYRTGEIGKAAALLKASEVSTGAAKSFFNYPRPFLIDGNTIRFVPDRSVAADGAPYVAVQAAFPSGHSMAGYTDTILLAVMLPERFLPLIDRGAVYGYSRIVLGVHYPLDVVGSRIAATRNVAHFLDDPAYRKLFDEARAELRQALEKECGAPLADCAKPAGAADPWVAPELRDFYAYTMTYDFPQSGTAGTPMEVPAGAEVLLDTLAPALPAAERRSILERTALASGYPLDPRDKDGGFWSRLDLHEAALAVGR